MGAAQEIARSRSRGRYGAGRLSSASPSPPAATDGASASRCAAAQDSARHQPAARICRSCWAACSPRAAWRSTRCRVVLDPTIKALMPDPGSARATWTRRRAALADAIEQARDGRHLRRLRRRRRLLVRADGALPRASRRCRARIYIPDRLTEGYGPNAAAIEGARQGRRQAHRHRRLRHHQLRAAGARRPSSAPTSIVVDHHQADERAAARVHAAGQSQPPGRHLGARPPVRGRRRVHGAGGDRARAAPARLLRRRHRRAGPHRLTSTSSRWRRCATWCRSTASTAPTSPRACRSCAGASKSASRRWPTPRA